MTFAWVFISAFLTILLYLVWLNRILKSCPQDIKKLVRPAWTRTQMLEAYEKCDVENKDFIKQLPLKTGRRYVIVGGSGLVGGWIVEHLLERGEAPEGLLILDTRPPTRKKIITKNIRFIEVDIKNSTAVHEAFKIAWPDQYRSRPLTVFHAAAYIDPKDRWSYCLRRYLDINVEGTRNVINASISARCSVFIATSSASVGLQCVKYFIWPWSSRPKSWLQISDNGNPTTLKAKLDAYPGCYAYSKARAENLVLRSDSKENDFRTGVIRPGHSIYGHGIESPTSLAYDYLRRGGGPTWLRQMTLQLVSAQNVSLAHLEFESRLIASQSAQGIGGKAFTVADPGEPIQFGHLYDLLSTLAHEKTPVRFPEIPTIPMLLLSYPIEIYFYIRQQYLNFLPEIKGDLAQLQPNLFQLCTRHIIYDTTKARDELGYSTSHDTLEGLCLQVKEWNSKQDSKI